jgi:hypothetical protein
LLLAAVQRASLVRSVAEVGCSLPLALLNGLVGSIMTDRVPGVEELAALAYGLARMGRKVRPCRLADTLQAAAMC